MKSNIDFPRSKTDENLVAPWDLQLHNRYFYFSISCTKGEEDSMTWSTPTIRSFYLRPIANLRSWWKEHWAENNAYKKSPLPISQQYHLVAAIFDTNSSRLNDSPLTTITKHISIEQVGSVLGKRKDEVFEICRGRNSFFTNGKKHIYVYKDKKDCLAGLIRRIQEELEGIDIALPYITNQLWTLRQRKPVWSMGLKPSFSTLPSFVPVGSQVWISRYESTIYNWQRASGAQCYGPFSEISVLPTPIKTSCEIPDWNKGFSLESDELISTTYSSRALLGRTNAECMSKYLEEKESRLYDNLENLERRRETILGKLEKMKKSLEKL